MSEYTKESPLQLPGDAMSIQRPSLLGNTQNTAESSSARHPGRLWCWGQVMEKVFRGTFQFAVASAPIHFARPASNKPPQSMGLKQQKITSLICSCQYQGVGKVVLFRRPPSLSCSLLAVSSVVLLYTSVWISSSNKGTSHDGLRPILMTSFISLKTLPPNIQSDPKVLKVRPSTYEFWGHNSAFYPATAMERLSCYLFLPVSEARDNKPMNSIPIFLKISHLSFIMKGY